MSVQLFSPSFEVIYKPPSRIMVHIQNIPNSPHPAGIVFIRAFTELPRLCCSVVRCCCTSLFSCCFFCWSLCRKGECMAFFIPRFLSSHSISGLPANYLHSCVQGLIILSNLDSYHCVPLTCHIADVTILLLLSHYRPPLSCFPLHPFGASSTVGCVSVSWVLSLLILMGFRGLRSLPVSLVRFSC